MLALGLLLAGGPDLSGAVQLIGKGSMAHACPVGEQRLLTAAHVGQRGSDPRFYRFQQGPVTGTTTDVSVWQDTDLAEMKTDRPMPIQYPLAVNPPLPETHLWIRGYDFRKGKDMLAPRDWEVTVIRTVAGHIVFKPTIDFGTSGSCVLNSLGEVVGIVSMGIRAQNDMEVGVAVGVWGDLSKRTETE